MTLREELAVRLVVVAGGVPLPGGMGWDIFLKQADECIRQMEWARQFCPDPDLTLTHVDGSIDTVANLTLAPEDWKP